LKYEGFSSFLRNIFLRKEFGGFVYIVGAQKAGTTSLHSFLACHPDIAGASGKEAHFFDVESAYEKGEEYYSSFFASPHPAKYALDSTPAYLYYAKAPERIHAFSPDAKIVILLREPVSRAFSAFNMYKQAVGNAWFASQLVDANPDAKTFFMPIAEGNVSPDIDYFLDYELSIMNGEREGDEPALIRRGIYAPQIEQYANLFGLENILILFSDDMRNNTKETLQKVFSFIGIEPCDSIDFSPKHVREYTVSESGKDRIQQVAGDFFAKDKQMLIDDYNLDVPW